MLLTSWKHKSVNIHKLAIFSWLLCLNSIMLSACVDLTFPETLATVEQTLRCCDMVGEASTYDASIT